MSEAEREDGSSDRSASVRRAQVHVYLRSTQSTSRTQVADVRLEVNGRIRKFVADRDVKNAKDK